MEKTKLYYKNPRMTKTCFVVDGFVDPKEKLNTGQIVADYPREWVVLKIVLSKDFTERQSDSNKDIEDTIPEKETLSLNYAGLKLILPGKPVKAFTLYYLPMPFVFRVNDPGKSDGCEFATIDASAPGGYRPVELELQKEY